MDELMSQFAVEARELVQQAADDLLALEHTPDDRARLESAFRAVHTLKGSVGLFDFGPMHEVLHRAEDLLSGARADAFKIDTDLIDRLLAVIGWVDRCVTQIEKAGKLSENLREQSVGILSLLRVEPVQQDVPAAANGKTPAWATDLLIEAGLDNASAGDLTAIRYEPHAECFFNGDDPLANIAQLSNIVHLKISPKNAWPSPDSFDPFRCNLVIEALATAPLSAIHPVFRLIPDQVLLADLTRFSVKSAGNGGVDETPAVRPSSIIRVDTSRLDALVEIAGELVTAKNGLLPLAREALRTTGDERLSRMILASHQEIERLVSALYGGITRSRMIPVGDTFRRFPRLVREIAARLGKPVDLVIEGETVEADREIVEALFEPLLHLVRNALDHGFETEGERQANGKPGHGTLILRARQRDEILHIELADDGKGVDMEKVRAASVFKGLIPEAGAAELSDAAVRELLFMPGFSTAQSITELSGRGVGLDAVKAAIEKLGGRINLASEPGRGTAVSLRLPISFSMSKLMVIEVAGERYGISMDDILETVRLARGDVKPVRVGWAFVLRDKTVPLLYLSDLLKLPSSSRAEGDLKILIVRTVEDKVGIAVDTIAERAETLMRPLSGLLRGLPGVSGTALLGDGKVLVVLKLQELIAVTIRIEGQQLHLEGVCGAEEADILFGYLAEKPDLVVVLAQAERLHTSIWQILLMMETKISGKPSDNFSAEWVLPAILLNVQKAPETTLLADGQLNSNELPSSHRAPDHTGE